MKLMFMLSNLFLGHTDKDVVNYIKELNPTIGIKAEPLAKAINRVASKYDVDPMLIVSLIRQESNFRTGLKACWAVQRYNSCQTTCDYGIMQVNELWIKKLHLDASRLLNDNEYNINVAVKILKGIKSRFSTKEPKRWWSRYNSGTPSKRALYEAKVALFASR